MSKNVILLEASDMNGLAELVAEKLFAKLKGTVEVAPKEMNTRQVRQHLLEKGYRVKDHRALCGLIESHKIEYTERSKEHWYPTDKILAIPPRTK